MAIPFNVNPIADPMAVQAAINQQGHVWFIAGPLGGNFDSSRTIPEGTAILVPLLNYINDYPCPSPPPFEPAPGQTLEDFLRDGAEGIIDLVTVHDAELDGASLNIDRVASSLFPFTAAGNLVAFDPCVTGSPQLAASDGYWVFLKPLSRGDQHLHTHTELHAFGLVTDSTTHITIVKDKP